MHEQTTRRQLLGSALVAGVATAGISRSAIATRQDATPDAATPYAAFEATGEATSPSWKFSVGAYQDPYEGDITWPAEPREGTRYIGAEVEIRNESDAPLNFLPSSVRPRGNDGAEYLPGSAVGTEPRLSEFNLPPGEKTRGWAWFVVPEEAEIVEIFYVGPLPRLVIPVSRER